MENNNNTIQPFSLKKGFSSQEIYNDYSSMNESASDNWDFKCTYQLLPQGLSGEHKVLQLDTMQLSYAKRPGGMMQDTSTAKGSIAIGIIEYVADKACFDRMKLKSGDILFFDDSKPFNVMSNDTFNFSVISIHKNTLGKLLPKFTKALNHRIKDKDKILETLLYKIWEEFSTKNSESNYKAAEKAIIKQITTLLENQTLIPSTLTRGEEIALAIRDQVYHHMDGNVNISKLAEQYKVSEKTLQNSFKSFYGFTPKYFLRQLKLNLIHHELKKSDPKQSTVSKIALKWGFKHMGRFSSYYTELYGENPSQTLRTDYQAGISIAKSCVSRQEEMI